jgi:RNA polymerase sigma-70 factor (ECF subfamily)
VTDNEDFPNFLRRIRAGDDAAAMELVRRYEPLIRREVRLRFGSDRFRRAFDSVDVSQSVLANFFVRAAAGGFALESPEQLARLLIVMARNKLISRVRSERRLVRDVRRLAAEPGVLEEVADPHPSPSRLALKKEELELLTESLSAEDRQIMELRSAGLSWDEVGTRLGGSAQARRMQLVRGLRRLQLRLGLTD